MSLLESLVEEDFGFKAESVDWGRSESHSSLVIDRRNDTFYFNSSPDGFIAGDAFTYLTKVRKLSAQVAKEIVKHRKGSTSFITDINKGVETTIYPGLVSIFHDNLLQSKDKQYLVHRTVNDLSIDRFMIGKYGEFYTFPIYCDGLLKQIQLRKDNPKTIRRYYKGISPNLFNSDIMKFTDEIVFVEGLVSSIVLTQNGISAVSCDVSARAFQPQWFRYFARMKKIYLLYDNDPAGINGAKKASQILGKDRCYSYNFEGFDENYDANDWFIDGGSASDLLDVIHKNSKRM